MADDAVRVRLDVEGGHGALLVGEQRHPRGARVDAGHRPRNPSSVTTGSSTRDAVVRAHRDDDRLRERARRTGDHRGGEARVVLAGSAGRRGTGAAPQPSFSRGASWLCDDLLAQRLVLLREARRRPSGR